MIVETLSFLQNIFQIYAVILNFLLSKNPEKIKILSSTTDLNTDNNKCFLSTKPAYDMGGVM